MIRVVIIETDTFVKQRLLDRMPKENSRIQVVSAVSSCHRGLMAIKKEKPDIVFVNVVLCSERFDGFFKLYEALKFDVIFSTQYDICDIGLLKFRPLSYMVTPLEDKDIKNICTEIGRHTIAKRKPDQVVEKETKVPSDGNAPNPNLLVTTDSGYRNIAIRDLVRAEAFGNYTKLYVNGTVRPFLVCGTLKELSDRLPDSLFVRVHRKHLVNNRHIVEFSRNDGGYVILSDKSQIAFSRRMKTEFLRQFE